MSLQIYLMRHGETLFNTRKVEQGQCDSPLTAKGIFQAVNEIAEKEYDPGHERNVLIVSQSD